MTVGRGAAGVNVGPAGSGGGGLNSTQVDASILEVMQAYLDAGSAVIRGTSVNPPLALVEGTNFDYLVLDYPDASDTYAYWKFRMPPNVSTGKTLTITIRWISTVNANDVVWDVQIIGRASGEALDAALATAKTVTTTAPGTAGLIAESSVSFTSSDTAIDANDEVIVKILRNGDAAGDTMTAAARFLEAAVRLS